MTEIIYLSSDGRKRTVLVGTDNVIAAQRLAADSDSTYMKCLGYTRLKGTVVLVHDEPL